VSGEAPNDYNRDDANSRSWALSWDLETICRSAWRQRARPQQFHGDEPAQFPAPRLMNDVNAG